MSGPPAKAPENRIRRNVDAVAAVVPPVATPPPVPTGISRPALVDEWRELWASPIAATITVTDLPALSRLFRLKQQFDVASDRYEDEPVVEGSKGQPVMNDAGRHVLALAAQILALEDRFGLHPKGRLANGIRLGAAVDAAKRHPEAFGHREEVDDVADPRLAEP